MEETRGVRDHYLISHGLGKGKEGADFDIGIRVSPEKFDKIIKNRLATKKVSGDSWKTLQEAIKEERIHAGVAGISGIRRELVNFVTNNFKIPITAEAPVHLAIINAISTFDKRPFVSLF